jgi:acyl-CoA thioesterase-2
MRTPENLAEILDLEAIEVNLFRGVSPNDGFPGSSAAW